MQPSCCRTSRCSRRRSEEHTSELQSPCNLVCRLLLEKKRFYHHITLQELTHEVRHSAFQATIRGGPPLQLQLYQQENAAHQPLVIFTSGDGGWSPFCADMAAHIAANGITVVGIDAKDYLVKFATPQKPISAEELTRDYDEIAQQSLAQPGIDAKTPLILAGWSLGAGYSVIVA